MNQEIELIIAISLSYLEGPEILKLLKSIKTFCDIFNVAVSFTNIEETEIYKILKIQKKFSI